MAILSDGDLAALPIGTSNAQAFARNAGDIDSIVNGGGVIATRTGKSILTVNDALARIGYEMPVSFASGIVVTRASQTVVSSSLTYHANPASIPFTTNGTFNSAQWLLISNVTLQALIGNTSDKGAGLIGTTAGITLHQLLQPMSGIHTDGTNTITGSGRVFIGNKAPSTDDSALLIGRNLAGSYNTGAHAVRDESSWNYSGAGLGGYASYDSIVSVTGGLTYDHLTSFQARPQYSGVGLMGRLAGYTCQVGNTSTGTVYDAMGIKIDDVSGTGPVTNNFGIYISALSRGSAFNYAIYSGGTAQSYHGGRITVGDEVIAKNLNVYDTPSSYRATGGMLVAYNGSGQGVLRAYSNNLGAAGTIAFTGPSGQFAQFDVNGYLLCGFTGSNGPYRLQVNSQIYATSAVVATSDKRYKEAVEPIRGALGLVMRLEPVSFSWKKHAVHDFPAGRAVGFLAQDVAEVLADSGYAQAIVKSNSTKMPDGSTEEFLGLAEAGIVPLLTAALQSAIKQIEALSARVAILEQGAD